MPSVGSTDPITRAGVIAGGAAGQVLVKSSSTLYDAAFATITPGSGGEAYYLSGGWYDNRWSVSGLSLNFAAAANTCYYVPVYIAKDITIPALGYLSGTTANSSAVTRYLGLYELNAAGKPGTLITSASLSPVTTTSTSQTVTLTAPVTVTAGWKYLALCSGTAVFNILTVSLSSAGAFRTSVGTTGPNDPAGLLQTGFNSAGSTLSADPTVSADTSQVPPVVFFQVA